MSKDNLSDKLSGFAAGCAVDMDAAGRWGLDLATMRKLGEAYRAGWLHNVMARITPLTMRKREDYLAMADIFVDTKETAQNMLDHFANDMEMFCRNAGIVVTEHMNSENVSPELRAHVDLFMDISRIFNGKFGVPVIDPIEDLAIDQALTEHESEDPFIAEFVKKHFGDA